MSDAHGAAGLSLKNILLFQLKTENSLFILYSAETSAPLGAFFDVSGEVTDAYTVPSIYLRCHLQQSLHRLFCSQLDFLSGLSVCVVSLRLDTSDFFCLRLASGLHAMRYTSKACWGCRGYSPAPPPPPPPPPPSRPGKIRVSTL